MSFPFSPVHLNVTRRVPLFCAENVTCLTGVIFGFSEANITSSEYSIIRRVAYASTGLAFAEFSVHFLAAQLGTQIFTASVFRSTVMGRFCVITIDMS